MNGANETRTTTDLVSTLEIGEGSDPLRAVRALEMTPDPICAEHSS